MRILITGGAGFIGSNLAKTMIEAGHTVTVIDDLSTGYADNLDNMNIEFHHASILDEGTLDQAVAGQDSIVHLAALGSVPRSIRNPGRSHEVNATGTLKVLESARREGVGHVIMSSSSSVYGSNPALPKHEREWVRPMSPYAVSKLAAEQYLLAYQSAYDMQTLAFRFFNVYGPGQRAGHVYAAVIPIFLDALLRGEPLPINGDGTNSRDFTYVGTVCEVLKRAVENRSESPEPVNLAFGTNTSLIELTEKIAEVTGFPVDLDFRAPRAGDVPHSQAANEKLRNLFPSLQPTSLTQGLRETFAWFQSTISKNS
ncbi:NAD-dependent epimerase/dehydratase family protein [Janibacter sp. CX7]|uniref:NAD-dependent epimerase/dehydratase family protein n=1 Tax=Janibacter sp. CX7 TaxID=2963431 RepID=UPI0020CD6F79|nr:NAD-dependent epimerase/dehydratase family protein [Janibacter sp. CX7]UTT66877.1 NAD-dependent epimerase/dehydratase family protein [Janibacter sp. CX7]